MHRTIDKHAGRLAREVAVDRGRGSDMAPVLRRLPYRLSAATPWVCLVLPRAKHAEDFGSVSCTWLSLSLAVGSEF